MDPSTLLLNGSLQGDYQIEGFKWMYSKDVRGEGGILADDMGLGKTMQAIALCRASVRKTLIVTTVATVAQWRDALISFGGFKPILIQSSMKICGLGLKDDDVALTSYSVFQRGSGMECLKKEIWGRIILDEGHTIRNKTTKLFLNISVLRADVKWVLSGTPVQNSEADLMTLAEFIGATSECVVNKESGEGRTSGDKTKRKRRRIDVWDIDSFCDQHLLRRTQEQVGLMLPQIKTEVVRLSFKREEEKAVYKRIENQYRSIMSGDGEGRGLMNKSFKALEGILKCRQVCTHMGLMGGGRGLNVGESTKMSYLCDRIKKVISGEDDRDGCSGGSEAGAGARERMEAGKIIVFCSWIEEMKMISRELHKNGIAVLTFDGALGRDQKECILYNFKNTDSIRVLLLQINCGSCGLNLQEANHVYITSPHWNPCIELQAIGRAYRKGQTRAVTCTRLVMSDTIEERCYGLQMKKLAMISECIHDDNMIKRMIGGGGSSSGEDLNGEEIRMLFGSG